jgi:hypothetical protein
MNNKDVMAKFTFNADEKKTNYELQLGDKFDFFKIFIIEEKKEMSCFINVSEAELLVVALKQFIDVKKK